MKVLLINRRHFVGGGADKVYLNTGELLKDHGFNVAYFSTSNENNEFTEYAQYFTNITDLKNATFIEKIKLVNKYLYNTEASQKLSVLLKRFNPDIAHIHLFYGALSASILKTLKQFKIPTVITIHDYRLLCPANAMLDKNWNICEACKGKKFFNCLVKRCSHGNFFNSAIITAEAYLRAYGIVPTKLIDHFIFVSQFSRRKHISFDVKYENRSSLLYNFTNFLPFESTIKGDYLLYFGRLSREKGVINLINAVKKSSTKLLIVGEGTQRDQIIKETKGIGLIKYVGFKRGHELNGLIQKSSFIVVPSEWYENNPMTIVEAFSMGKPVIGADIGGIPELVSKDTGFLFKSGDLSSLSEVLDKANKIGEEEYKKISNNCRVFAEKHFSKEKHFQTLSKIYQSIINESKKSCQ